MVDRCPREWPSFAVCRLFRHRLEQPLKTELGDQVLLPILATNTAACSRAKVRLRSRAARFRLRLLGARMAVAPNPYISILEPVLNALLDELEPDGTRAVRAPEHHHGGRVPAGPHRNRRRIEERPREKEIIKRRLDALPKAPNGLRRDRQGGPCSTVSRAIRIFDRLDRPYATRPTGSPSGVSRRMKSTIAAFDINDARRSGWNSRGLRGSAHPAARALSSGAVTGLRIDHRMACGIRRAPAAPHNPGARPRADRGRSTRKLRNSARATTGPARQFA